MYIDFHTHILPNIDDGAKDIAMSVDMLKLAKECGAETVILTPHVDASSDHKEFLRIRQERFNELCDAMGDNKKAFPEMMLGAEVLLDTSLSERDDVRSLCIEGTELILLELPYDKWNSWYNHEIYNLISKHEVTPVLAHIERYMKTPKDLEKLDALISFGVKFQINASSFLSFWGKRIIRDLAANGNLHAIASDAHNLTNRSPNISKSLKVFEKKFGYDFLDFIYDKTLWLIEDNRIK